MRIPKIGDQFMKLPPAGRLTMPKSLLRKVPNGKAPSISAKDFQAGLDLQSEYIAQQFLELLIKNIRANKYNFKLSENTLKKRRSRGNSDETPLIDQGYLINSLVRNGSTVTIAEGTHPTGIKFLELAMMLEYGRKDKGIPAFPVARNTFADFEPTAKKLLFKFLNAAKK
jgi:hypothetical protein